MAARKGTFLGGVLALGEARIMEALVVVVMECNEKGLGMMVAVAAGFQIAAAVVAVVVVAVVAVILWRERG